MESFDGQKMGFNCSFTMVIFAALSQRMGCKGTKQNGKKPIIIVDHSRVEHGGSQARDVRSGQIQSIF